MISKRFYKYDKVVIKKNNFSVEELNHLKKDLWMLKLIESDGFRDRFDEESIMIYSIARLFYGKKVTVDPKIYDYDLDNLDINSDEIFKFAVCLEQNIPAFFPISLEIRTNSELDNLMLDLTEKRKNEFKNLVLKIQEIKKEFSNILNSK